MKYIISLFILFIFCCFISIGCNLDKDAVGPVEKNNLDKIGSTWYIPGDFSTIQDAINSSSVVDGDILMLGEGNFTGVLLTKGVVIIGGENTVINSGPAHSSGFFQGFRLLAGSDNAVFKNLIFTTPLSIMNGASVSNVEVSHCTFLNSLQAVSNWGGDNWNIHHNTITDLQTSNGGGIGILIAERFGGTVSGNIISHNTISGILHMASNEQGGYSGSGIVIYADFRYGYPGAVEIKDNFVTHNNITLISENPALVDVIAFELTDTRDDPNMIILFNNSIGFNDFRGTSNQIVLTPEVLDNPVNNISGNLGDNRGHGLNPQDFKP